MSLFQLSKREMYGMRWGGDVSAKSILPFSVLSSLAFLHHCHLPLSFCSQKLSLHVV